ncbi:hypothetical protein F2Q69_00037909 [Brassica cretica]|uniref:NB-ARC domain-containing protein n=1 Tax=Brassica cretica TaxID=69181 RepID=A0A8S9SGS4_BRACR|nr:hypothetical protein F2Q69_00037909 [Brassica cretica]
MPGKTTRRFKLMSRGFKIESAKDYTSVTRIDDLWEEVRLSEIGIPVLESGQYRVVFTTRSEDVCGSMGAIEKIKVELLGNTDAWDLFKATARSSELSNEISDAAKEIAANCHGLPLALKVIGKTMASKTTLDEWSRALDTLKDDPGELKEYWIGEGFLDEKDGRHRTKCRGYDIVDTLVRASLLQKEGESELMKVSMHDTIRDMVLWARSKDSKYKDKDGEIFVVRAGAGLSKLPDDMDWTTVTKMSLMNNEIGGIPDDYEFSNPDRLVTLFLQNNKLVNNVGNFFRALSTLVVLDLSHNLSITKLPEEISMFVALRYLSLLGTMIEGLPEGFENLTQLIHLDLESTLDLQNISVSLVSGLLKLQVFKALVQIP